MPCNVCGEEYQGIAGDCRCTNYGNNGGSSTQTVEAEIKKLEALVNGFTVILVEVNEHLAILRTVVRYMLLQATADEVDQTEEGNPWKKLHKDYVTLMNPHIKALNAMLGIKVEDAPTPKSVVVVKQ